MSMDESQYTKHGYIPMCANKSRAGFCCLYDDESGRWFKVENRPCRSDKK